jgi:glyoxylase-like metal-dependent hydrolase (beta-lactamase superfamily II)
VSLEVRKLTVGAIAENCFLVRREGAEEALVVDPGEEAERILAEVEAMGVEVEAILITHCHFDHIGAVAPVAKATGAPVYCPQIETPMLADIMAFVPMAGFGPYESHEAEQTVKGGEALELAGLALDVIFTPGHSPGHVTYSVRGEDAIFSGDVLFQGSVGRVDLPGGDGPTLMHSIRTLLEAHSPETTVYPGHMGVTTLGAERETNPFLLQLAR